MSGHSVRFSEHLISRPALQQCHHRRLSPPVAVAADQGELGFYSCSCPLKSDGDPVLEHLRPAVFQVLAEADVADPRWRVSAFWSGAFIYARRSLARGRDALTPTRPGA